MTINQNALSGYASAAQNVRTDRNTEYAAFARMTHGLKAIDEKDRETFPALVGAVMDNMRLWGVLEQDLKNDGNALPVDLRVQLLSLAQFVRKHSRAVVSGSASVDPLIDINTSIMRGLRGVVEVAA
jgi:flagellar biosynthesis activator protein FlaF